MKSNKFFGLKSSFLKIEIFGDYSLQFPPPTQTQNFILSNANAAIFYPQTHQKFLVWDSINCFLLSLFPVQTANYKSPVVCPSQQLSSGTSLAQRRTELRYTRPPQPWGLSPAPAALKDRLSERRRHAHAGGSARRTLGHFFPSFMYLLKIDGQRMRGLKPC